MEPEGPAGGREASEGVEEEVTDVEGVMVQVERWGREPLGPVLPPDTPTSSVEAPCPRVLAQDVSGFTLSHVVRFPCLPVSRFSRHHQGVQGVARPTVVESLTLQVPPCFRCEIFRYLDSRPRRHSEGSSAHLQDLSRM